MGLPWTMLIRSNVFSRIVNNFSIKIDKKKLTRTNFSTKGNDTTKPTFPFVYVEELESSPLANGLNTKKTNGLNYSLQIEATDNKDEQNARQIIYEVQRIMLEMGFRCSSPIPSSTQSGIYRYVMRCSRTICEGDIY